MTTGKSSTGGIDRIAEAAMQRHRVDLNYADIQHCKRGDYEAVAQHLRRRKRSALRWAAATAAVMAILWLSFGESGFLWYALVFLMAVQRLYEEHLHARKTAQFLQDLREGGRVDSVAGDGAA